MEEGEHLRIKKRNSRAFEFLHLALLEEESQFAFTPGDFGEEFDESFGNCELFEWRDGEDKQTIEEEKHPEQSLY